MNIDLLKAILKGKGLYRKISTGGKNVIASCPICGDHPDSRKKNHLYISTEKNVFHCFYGGCKGSTTNLLKRLESEELIKDIFTKDELAVTKPGYGGLVKTGTLVRDLIKYEIPKIDTSQFPLKTAYVKRRTNYLSDIESIPGLIFDILKFVEINKIKIDENVFDLKFMHDNFIGVLMNNCTQLWLRCLIDDTPLKFSKIILQEDPLELVDYYSIPGGNINSNRIVITEGFFNCLGEYYTDSLKIRNNVKEYISSQGFDIFSSVLKSYMFNNEMFDIEVVVLSDQDKPISKYIDVVENNEHVLNNLEIYYNKGKKDFGTFDIIPIKGGSMKDVLILKNNKTSKFKRNWNGSTRTK